MDRSILDELVCPISKSKLYYDKEKQVLVCKAEKLAYPIRNGIPVMIVEEAIKLNIEEVKKYG